MPRTYRNYCSGEWIESKTGDTYPVTNPADTDEVVGRFQLSSAADTNRAIEAAVDAQSEWAGTPGPERGTVLRRTASLLENRSDELTETLCREEGKTRDEAAGEVQRAIDIFYYYAEKARDFDGTVKPSSSTDSELHTKREPLGTVGLITPWNYPIAIPAWKLAPALASGNTVILKPASEAPAVSHAIVDCLDEAGLPAGVVNFVTGPGSEVGAALYDHEAVDGISFTGSTSVGTMVARAATDDLKRVQCEMGGKNPTIVMPSADVDEAAEIVGGGAFGTTGQSCTACSRAIVHEDVYDEFLESITAHAESIDVGPGLENPGMGPHVSDDELESTLEYIDVGANEGATIETGGSRLSDGQYDRGHFVEPTVFSGVTNDMRIAQEEIFGPVLSVIAVSDFAEALEVANDVEFGLSASILTQDLTEANRFVDEIEAGVAKVNEKTTGLELHVPFGGYKNSSTNTYREQGDAGLDFFTTTKTVYMNY
ncbi:aldehyde dehydrogenase family protein [Natronorubrum sp. FCH18a]|uniref:2,5-dioxovalerate dehydrogenase n=1 Tax=Natronorubrum sp. FCH18a TaxID=3447018 RepID=UPI003F511252